MVIAFVTYTIEILKYYIIMRYLLQIEDNKNKMAKLFATLGIILFSVIAYDSKDNLFLVFTLFVVFELFLLFKDKIIKKVLISLWLLFFVSMLDVMMSTIIEFIVYLVCGEMSIRDELLVMFSNIVNVILISTMIILVKKKTLGYNFSFSLKYYFYLTMLAIIEGITVGLLQDMVNDWGAGMKTYILSFVVVLMMLVNIGMVVFLAVSRDGYKQMNSMNSEYMKRQEEQYNYIQNMNVEIRKFKHDYTHHINVLEKLIDNEEFDEAKTYVARISDALYINDNNISVGNGIVDAILNQYVKEAVTNEVNFQVCGKLEECEIEPYDLCSIFVNVLKNALEAAKNSDEKYINVEIENKEECLEISVINSFKGELKKENNKYNTTKKDTQNHGFGIENIMSSVHKYDGKCIMCDDGNMFVVNIKFEKDLPNL